MERVTAWWRSRDIPAEAWITVVVLAAAVIFTLMQLQPSLLVSRSTPAGGDTGAHVWGPWFLRHHIFTHLRLTGWAPSWYAGFPAYVFYFPLPAFLIAVASFVLPYTVAFKFVTVLGILSLPVAAWAFGRLSGMRFPGPVLLGVATVPFLFYSGFSSGGGSWSFTIYGGNIASTLAGEFSFSISLSLALVFLGVMAKVIDTGRYRALAAVLLALTGLSHLLPTLFALCGAAILLVLRPSVARAKVWATVIAIGALLAAFWSVPFLFRLPYSNNMGWEKLTDYSKNLVPHNIRGIVAMAAVGAVASIVYRRRTGLALVGLAAASAAVFVAAPQARLWNARALPFWYLSVFLLAGVAVAETAGLISRLLAVDPDHPPRQVSLAAPAVAALAAWIFVGAPLGVLPSWAPSPSSPESSFLPAWAKWNYSGYEGKTAYPEYKAIVDTMSEVGRTTGCGRAHWEYDSSLDRFGTPMALMLLPYWTKGCIDSMEGLYFESSATVPYHFLTAAQLSKAPSNPMRDLPYRSLDVAAGVRNLQLLGARYYMAFSPDAVSQAQADPDLHQVAQSRAWHVFEVAGSELVTPLTVKPAVLTGAKSGSAGWLDMAVNWFNDPARRDQLLASSGPKDWPRVAVSSGPGTSAANGKTKVVGSTVSLGATAPQPVAAAQVANIRQGDNSLSFDVDRTGSPVLVKVSYFPNWQASGAKGPWRVTPNLMVVIPTSKHVRLHYGNTPVDLGAWLLTLVGLGLAVFVYRRGPAAVGEARAGDALPEAPLAGQPEPDDALEDDLQTVPSGPPRGSQRLPPRPS
ncbi:MAG: 6-pyruvoyl-tetrahydropterin synthase-related protein [Acidimicrobiales bacterium]